MPVGILPDISEQMCIGCALCVEICTTLGPDVLRVKPVEGWKRGKAFVFYPENNSLREDLKSVIEKISTKRSLVIIDSFNGFFNHLEGEKDLGRLINSFLMLLVSSGEYTKSTVIVGILSKLNDENKLILYNTGRRVIDNEHFTKIQLIRSENSILTKVLNSDNTSNSHLIL